MTWKTGMLLGFAWIAGCGSVGERNIDRCEETVVGLCGVQSDDASVGLTENQFANCTVFGTEDFDTCDLGDFWDCVDGAVDTCENPDDWPYARDLSMYEAFQGCAAKTSCDDVALASFLAVEDTGYYEDCGCTDAQRCVLDDTGESPGWIGGEGVHVPICVDEPAECATAATACATDGTLGEGDFSVCGDAACGRQPEGLTVECVEGELAFICYG